MTATTDPARTERDTTTGTNRSPALPQPDLHNGDGDRRPTCAASAGTSGHALRLLDLARRAEQAQANRPAAARGTSDTTQDTPTPAPQPPRLALRRAPRRPITHTPSGQPFRRPVTPLSDAFDLYECALLLDRGPNIGATRAQLVALIWPEPRP